MGDAQDQWMQGLGLNIGQLRQAGSAQKSATPPGSPSAGGNAPAIADRLVTKIKAETDLRPDLAAIAHLDMGILLDIMARLKNAQVLDDFADRVTSENRRVGAAILTVNNQLDGPWQTLVASLSADDRKAILARVPAEARQGIGQGVPPSGKQGDAGPAFDADGAIAVGPEGVEVQASLTFHSQLTGNLGETQFTVHVGDRGQLNQFEVDVTAIKAKLDEMGIIVPMLELEATLSLNATMDLDQATTRVIFRGVQAQVKGEVEAHFRDIAPLKHVVFKLTATAGSGGFSVTGSIEIPIPGT